MDPAATNVQTPGGICRSFYEFLLESEIDEMINLDRGVFEYGGVHLAPMLNVGRTELRAVVFEGSRPRPRWVAISL